MYLGYRQHEIIEICIIYACYIFLILFPPCSSTVHMFALSITAMGFVYLMVTFDWWAICLWMRLFVAYSL